MNNNFQRHKNIDDQKYEVVGVGDWGRSSEEDLGWGLLGLNTFGKKLSEED